MNPISIVSNNIKIIEHTVEPRIVIVIIFGVEDNLFVVLGSDSGVSAFDFAFGSREDSIAGRIDFVTAVELYLTEIGSGATNQDCFVGRYRFGHWSVHFYLT